MTRFRAGHAAGADWREAVDACLKELMRAPQANPRKTNPPRTNPLGFLYVTDVIAEQAGEILDRLRKETGVEHWIGATGIGILGASANSSGEYYDQPAVSALIADLPDDSFRVFPGRGDDAAGAEPWERPATRLTQEPIQAPDAPPSLASPAICTIGPREEARPPTRYAPLASASRSSINGRRCARGSACTIATLGR
jgi:hypothetical protein